MTFISTTTSRAVDRGDQAPPSDDHEDKDYDENPPIFFHLEDYYRHPLQYTRSTRIPLYQVNQFQRG